MGRGSEDPAFGPEGVRIRGEEGGIAVEGFHRGAGWEIVSGGRRGRREGLPDSDAAGDEVTAYCVALGRSLGTVVRLEAEKIQITRYHY